MHMIRIPSKLALIFPFVKDPNKTALQLLLTDILRLPVRARLVLPLSYLDSMTVQHFENPF